MKRIWIGSLLLVALGGLVFGLAWQPTQVTAQENVAFELVMGDPAKGEFSFTPDVITLKNKQAVTFRVKNAGQITHELRSDLFRLFPFDVEIEGIGEVETVGIRDIDVDPGKEFLVVFTPNVSDKVLAAGAAEWEFACFLDGHYEGGMKGKIIVTP